MAAYRALVPTELPVIELSFEFIYPIAGSLRVLLSMMIIGVFVGAVAGRVVWHGC